MKTRILNNSAVELRRPDRPTFVCAPLLSFVRKKRRKDPKEPHRKGEKAAGKNERFHPVRSKIRGLFCNLRAILLRI